MIRAWSLLLCAAALAGAPPAPARGPKKAPPKVRPEDDPQLDGEAPAFARAEVQLVAPGDGAEVNDDPAGIPLQLEVQHYELGPAPIALSDSPAPFALLLVDNDGALRIDRLAPMRLRGLGPGPHLLRVVLSRPWGEVLKGRKAFALARIWVGKRQTDKAGLSAEAKVWPDQKKPLLNYVFPLGKLRGGLELVEEVLPAEASGEASADAGVQSLEAGVESVEAGADLSSAPPMEECRPITKADLGDLSNDLDPIALRPLPPQRALDFYLVGAHLKEHGRGDKVRVVVNQRELPMVRAWRPLSLQLKRGQNRLTIDLLDRRSTKVVNAVNRTDRTVEQP